MKTVTMVEFRKDAERVLRRVAKGERLVLSHHGKPVVRLEPVNELSTADPNRDPFLTVGRRATSSPKGRTKHQAIDRILYGAR